MSMRACFSDWYSAPSYMGGPLVAFVVLLLGEADLPGVASGALYFADATLLIPCLPGLHGRSPRIRIVLAGGCSHCMD